MRDKINQQWIKKNIENSSMMKTFLCILISFFYYSSTIHMSFIPHSGRRQCHPHKEANQEKRSMREKNIWKIDIECNIYYGSCCISCEHSVIFFFFFFHIIFHVKKRLAYQHNGSSFLRFNYTSPRTMKLFDRCGIWFSDIFTLQLQLTL